MRGDIEFVSSRGEECARLPYSHERFVRLTSGNSHGKFTFLHAVREEGGWGSTTSGRAEIPERLHLSPLSPFLADSFVYFLDTPTVATDGQEDADRLRARARMVG